MLTSITNAPSALSQGMARHGTPRRRAITWPVPRMTLGQVMLALAPRSFFAPPAIILASSPIASAKSGLSGSISVPANAATALIAAALGDVARAMGMTQLAGKAGVTREALYKALSPTGDPRLSTFLGVMKGLGLKLTPRAA